MFIQLRNCIQNFILLDSQFPSPFLKELGKRNWEENFEKALFWVKNEVFIWPEPGSDPRRYKPGPVGSTLRLGPSAKLDLGLASWQIFFL